VLASAVTAIGLVVGATMPMAHADTMDNIRGSVNTTRSHTTCPPLTYNPQLEAAAQAWARSSSDDGNSAGYAGVTTGHENGENDAQDSINRVNVALDATLHDCSWKDFGVGFYRDEANGWSHVAVFLGQPPAAPPPPPPPVCPDGTTVPAGHQCPAAPVNNTPPVVKHTGKPENSLKVGVDKQSDPFNVIFTVTNAGPIDGQCTYDAKKTAGLGQADVTQDFTLNGQETKPLTFPKPLLGATYHVVIACRGDYYGDQITFGLFQGDVSNP
jgi:hypothetical protein